MAYFYPIHYRFGMEMEQAMSQGLVERKQSAVLWLIYARAGDTGWVRRRDIVSELSNWFEVSQSKVSRLLYSLTVPPLELLNLSEAPDSSREKVVRLTPGGERFVRGMVAQAVDHLTARLGHMSRDELEQGLAFLDKAFRPSGE